MTWIYLRRLRSKKKKNISRRKTRKRRRDQRRERRVTLAILTHRHLPLQMKKIKKRKKRRQKRKLKRNKRKLKKELNTLLLKICLKKLNKNRRLSQLQFKCKKKTWKQKKKDFKSQREELMRNCNRKKIRWILIGLARMRRSNKRKREKRIGIKIYWMNLTEEMKKRKKEKRDLKKSLLNLRLMKRIESSNA